jgi:hypothetical protein
MFTLVMNPNTTETKNVNRKSFYVLLVIFFKKNVTDLYIGIVRSKIKCLTKYYAI